MNFQEGQKQQTKGLAGGKPISGPNDILWLEIGSLWFALQSAGPDPVPLGSFSKTHQELGGGWVCPQRALCLVDHLSQ